MASPGAEQQDGSPLQDAAQPEPEPALAEARRWIEQATGRGFGDKDFRSGLENGILLCELLNAIKPGLVKKINRLPTPIAGLDNIILFLRGCKELGLKESQLFDPGDLQDASNRVTVKNIDYSRKLKNVLVTIYWLGKAANSCTSYNGATLNLREFEGLLAQMRKETEDIESPKRSIRDSGYIDCWDSERSDSLSPPRHGRDDSFDSLDSFGSRSQQTPSPDVVLRGSSDGRGSDSESDLPHRKMPDVKKDDMSARRTSYGEPKSAVPFNQYLPNKSNQTAYIPAPLRKKKAEREEYRKSWSTATSPLGGERPFSQKPTCEDSETTPDIILRKENPFMMQGKDSGSEDEMMCRLPDLEKDDFAARRARMNQPKLTVPFNQFLYGPYTNKDKGKLEDAKKSSQKKKQEYARGNQIHMTPASQIVTRKQNLFLQCKDNESEEEEQVKMPDIQRDDLTKRKTQSNLSQQQESPTFIKASITQADLETWDRLKTSGETSKEDLVCPPDPESSAKIAAETAVRDDFATCKARAYKKASSPKQRFVHFGPVTEIDQQKWEKLSIARAAASDESEEETGRESATAEIWTESSPSATVCNQKSIGHTAEVSRPQNDPSEVAKSGTDEYCSGTPSSVSAACVIPQKQTLCRLSERHESNEEELDGSLPETERDDMMVRRMGAFQRHSSPIRIHSPPTSMGHHSLQQQKKVAHKEDLKTLQKAESSLPLNYTTEHCHGTLSPVPMGCTVTREESHVKLKYHDPISGGTEHKVKFPDPEKDDMMARRTGAFLKRAGPSANQFLPVPFSKQQNSQGTTKESVKTERKVKRFGPRTAVSDDAESMSMFDMRCEDEAVMQPHSKARHEKLQNVHNQLKEDETRWQDDLARWKSRRRSASQDLIKKEAERKKMEKLLSGDGASERRKSIKTYREIVEEKERREKELHEAYKNARSHEEAENILQQYIERFTISEAVLEHLQMPKILERSHSVEPNSSSPPKDPNPLKYLRQQSLPAPKYTTTIEATIVPTGELEASISTGHMSPSKTVVSKAVPMLTPKPYSQPKNTQQVLKNFKVDGKVSMNGETYNGVEEEKEKEYTTVMFAPSPSKSLKCEGVAREDGHPVELKQDITSIELSLQRPIPHRAHKETTVRAKVNASSLLSLPDFLLNAFHH